MLRDQTKYILESKSHKQSKNYLKMYLNVIKIPADILKCGPLREVDEGSLYVQTLDPWILIEGVSLLD